MVILVDSAPVKKEKDTELENEVEPEKTEKTAGKKKKSDENADDEDAVIEPETEEKPKGKEAKTKGKKSADSVEDDEEAGENVKPIPEKPETDPDKKGL